VVTVTGGNWVSDPYGQPLNATTGVVDTAATPTTRSGTSTTDAWLGQHQRGYEHTGALNQMLMGARTYLPALGIFTSTDPISGGSATAYDYCNQDPINTVDLNGTFAILIVGAVVLIFVAAVAMVYYSRTPASRASASRLGGYLAGGIQATGRGIWNSILYSRTLQLQTYGSILYNKAGKGTERENKQARSAANAAGLNAAQKRLFHDEITGQGIDDYQELVNIAKDIKKNFPNKGGKIPRG
jgi:RHS repeat-associated protein